MQKSGFAAIVGRPNVGKSTLLNTLVGERIAITTRKPQTTRNRITGIRNDPEGQCIFVDTPGIHRADNPLGRSLVATALSALADVDVAVFLIEANRGLTADDRLVIEKLSGAPQPILLAINKVDRVEKERLLPLIETTKDVLPFYSIIPLSALTGFNVDRLLSVIWGLLPEGPPLFPEDMMTDVSERFIAAEIIREHITLSLHQELPYTTAVVIDSFKDDEEKNLLRIQATIMVAKQTQKGIMIGKKGAMLKKIGTAARVAMERFFGSRVYLELFVKVKKDWHENPSVLRSLGYT